MHAWIYVNKKSEIENQDARGHGGKRKKAFGERGSKEPNQGGAERAAEVHEQMLPEQKKLAAVAGQSQMDL